MKKIITLLALAFCLNTNAQIISTVAGNGTAGYTGNGGQAAAAELNSPTGIAFDGNGNLYVVDVINNVVRVINTTGIIKTIAGNGAYGYSGDGGQATAANLGPAGVALDAAGNLYIADEGNNVIRKVIVSTGIINTIAGNGTGGYSGDAGQATAAELFMPYGLAVDVAGNLYIADWKNNRVRKVNTAGIISTYAGNGTGAYSGDGAAATTAELYNPYAVAFDDAGNLYISDVNNYRIREVNTAGIISTYAGNGNFGYSGDGAAATNAKINGTQGISFDAVGNLYIADANNNRMRMVNTAGIITTVTGNGTQGYSGDGGAATAAELNIPTGVAIDAFGNFYFTDANNQRLRVVCNNPDTLTGLITTPGSLPVNAGQVYIYRYQPGVHAGLLDTAGYANINSNGTYKFPGLPYGPYFVEAKPDTTTYPSAVSTYYSTKTNNYQWDSATFVTHRGCKNALYANTNISIIDLPAHTGTGVISGNVNLDASYGHRAGGNNIMTTGKSIDVKLGKNPAGGCTNRTTTDASGNYSFTQLDTGSYFVYVDIPNFIDTIANLHVTTTNSNFTNINYCVDSVKVHYCTPQTTGLKQFGIQNSEFSIYPNPNNGSFAIEPTNIEKQTMHVYDVNGKLVLSQTINGTTTIDASSLNEGVYNISIISNEGVANKRLVIVR